ncbi:MAG: hypothetical protein A2033_05970 [Bacteroidetes bacterium GWA2_31_9]|nr:MAG: hypothetical protein A2033_05970 [Bacteroidetes bacterium GWA2_31_9]
MSKKVFKYLFLVFFIIISDFVFAQSFSTFNGFITDKNKKPIELANITFPNLHIGTRTDSLGFFQLKVPVGKDFKYIITCVGFFPISGKIESIVDNVITINPVMEIDIYQFPDIEIEDKHQRLTSLEKIDPKTIKVIPGAISGVEAILKTLPGVSSNNELSSQYSVRGGNYDENLVYVNDIEVYRPFLVRSGQQEGLSFINPDMISSILFSAGGFESKYGDKMSSVLDIKYKKPYKTGGSASMSLLGSSVHFEGASKNHRFTHISGLRYKTTKYLLNSLETKGDYSPSFIDFQTFLTYDITENLELDFLGNYAQNKYLFVPASRKTAFGNINIPLGLTVYFDGKEIDKFTTLTGAFSLNHKINNDFEIKWIASAYRTIEKETYDIQGQYFINELDKELGSDNVGDSLMNIGVGTYLDHARNYLDAYVFSFSNKGILVKNENTIKWGLNYQREIFYDKITEWRMLDSAGYSLPYTDSVVSVSNFLKTNIHNSTNRITGYLQNNYFFEYDSVLFNLTYGIRANYWDFNNEFLVSPRASLSFEPNWKRDFVFRFSTGYYYQPPFYKELRDVNGNVNYNIKAQKSIHFLVGSDYNFTLWNRPFKLITEAYYKILKNLITYEIDNVRISYSGENNAKGYAVGLDLKMNGEFVKGIDSWASLSIMQTEEDINNDSYILYEDSLAIEVHPGYIPRPTDQRVNFGLFFQDYLPGNPSYKMHLNLLFGSRLPFGSPNSVQYRNAFRIPPYRRVDIGFSKVLISEDKKYESKLLKNFKSAWITLEVFNLLGTNNTISYMWISDIYNRKYAIPNYLTSRRLNLKMVIYL